MKTKFFMLIFTVATITSLSGCAEIGGAIDETVVQIRDDIRKARNKNSNRSTQTKKPKARSKSPTQSQTVTKSSHKRYPKEMVTFMQRRLNDVGYHAGTVDGLFGQTTSNALRNLQKSEGLRQTGQPNRETLIALGADQNIIAMLNQKAVSPKQDVKTEPSVQKSEPENQQPTESQLEQETAVTETIETRTAAKINEATELKVSPDIFSETIIELGRGKNITINSREGEWTHVSVDGKQGYVYSDFISE